MTEALKKATEAMVSDMSLKTIEDGQEVLRTALDLFEDSLDEAIKSLGLIDENSSDYQQQEAIVVVMTHVFAAAVAHYNTIALYIKERKDNEEKLEG